MQLSVNHQRLPNELLTSILTRSAGSYFTEAFHELILLNKSFHFHLLACQSAVLHSTFKLRPDLLFQLEPYRSWLKRSAASERTVISLLQSNLGYWRAKVSRELLLAWEEEDEGGLPPELLNQVNEELRSSKCSAHSLARYAVQYSKVDLVRFLLRDLGASASQKHLYFYDGAKDFNLANPLWKLDFDQNVELLRMLVHEFGIDTGVYNGFTTVFEDYVMRDEDLNRDVLWLLVEGGAATLEMIEFQASSEYLDLWERNHSTLLEMFCHEERVVRVQGVSYRLPAEGVQVFLKLADKSLIFTHSSGWKMVRDVIRRGGWTLGQARQFALDNELRHVITAVQPQSRILV
ncbi:hypothetical protein BJ742DRAFT_816481 [Cladochytrium replicatum]|nr:hypothetical protein BJ742DRAFT_816481 [Cladochytrium replicatum]